MSIFKIVAHMSYLTTVSPEVHALRMDWFVKYDAVLGHAPLDCHGALSLPAMMVQHGDNTFTVLCRMSVWYKRKVADKAKDISKADRRRWQDLLDMVEFNINYMKANRRTCDEFLDIVYSYKQKANV